MNKLDHSNPPDALTLQRQDDHGNAEVQFALGLQLSSGAEESLDLPQAAQWYRKAANQNHALAQYNLGIMYAKGQGMPRDDAKAAAWMRRSADLGDAGAQFNLGMRYQHLSVASRSEVAKESRIEAYKWLQLAAAQGYQESAAAAEHISQNMTHNEIAEGQRRVDRFEVGPVRD